MSLAAGTRLGPYEVLAPLGAGGMGEVYRARDTRLERSVAIKVLPADLAADPERRARFEREARTISTLTHPHICALYDVGDHEGVPYLVMEHLAGETLADRLVKGSLPLEQALDIGAQVAEALDAAHKHGIVHRDLKPANVMLTKAGAVRQGALQAKLLDFGLAKLRPPEGVRLVRDSSATVTQGHDVTAAGTLVGTLPYMAPEQVEGREADARTDLWALGCLLFEMVTGQRAFEGATAGSLVGAILAKEPPALASRQPLTPPALERLVKRCLAKDPDQRWDSAHDVADELRWIAQDSGVKRAEPDPLRVVENRRTSRRRFGLAVVVLGAIATAVATAAILRVMSRQAQGVPDVEIRQVLLDTRPAEGLSSTGSPELTLNRPSRTALAITPDGRHLVFAGVASGHRQLFVRALREAEARPMPGTDQAVSPVLSPDGRWVAFFVQSRTGRTDEGALKRLALDGSGPPVEICKAPAPFGMDWADDGAIVFATNENAGLFRVPIDGGTPTPITNPRPGELGHRLPHVLPGSRAVLFTVVEQPWNWETARVVVHRFGSTDWREIARGAADARYLPSGHLVYFRRGQLMAVAFDLDRLQPIGAEVGVVPNVMQSTNGVNMAMDLGAAQATVSQTGALAYVAGGEFPDPNRPMVWVDRRGQVEPLSAPTRPYYVPRLSPDGQRVAVQTLQSERRIWVHDLRVPGSLVPVTSPEVGATIPLWTPDGDRLAFAAYEKGGAGLFLARSDGTEPPERLASVERQPWPGSWTPDGQLLYLRYLPERRFRIHLLSRKGDRWEDRPLVNSPADERYPQVSPDGRWLAYVTNESGRFEVYVRRFPSLADRRPVSTNGGTSPVWSRDGRELFYVSVSSPDSANLVVHDVGPEGGPAPTGRALFALVPRRLSVFYPVHGFDTTPDGRRFLFTQWPDTTPPPPPNQINLVFNWFEELKAKVPKGN